MQTWSRYNYILDSNEIGKFIYNARTNSFTKINSLISDIISKHNKDFDKLPPKTIIKLKELKIIVDENDDDDYYYNKKYLRYIDAFSTKNLTLTIATTTKCNFRCPYCYEEGTLKKTSNKTIDDSIIRVIQENEAKKVKIIWYGGEPLLNFKSIKYISQILKDNFNGKSITYSMVTNGYLLTKNVVDVIKKYNYYSIQITIDGLKDTNDKTRILSNGEGSFNVIIKNLEYALKNMPKCDFNIRVNIDKNNMEEYPKLYNFIKDKFPYNNLFIYHSFTVDYKNDKNSCCISKMEEAHFEKHLIEKYNISGINLYPSFSLGGCVATSSNCFVIGPEGFLYKCWVDIGKQDRIVGCILKNNSVNPNYCLLSQYMVNADMYNDLKCKSCFLFPVCDGGCAYKRLTMKDKTSCCTIFPNDIGEYLKLEYKRRQLSKKE